MSQGSTNSRNSKVNCSCGHAMLVRIVKNGPNPGTKYYGCPIWPNTSCKMLMQFDDKKVVDELKMKLLESCRTIEGVDFENRALVAKIGGNEG
ncbi:DNA topoisomerase 3-alpha [Bienertia sinuspersici]